MTADAPKPEIRLVKSLGLVWTDDRKVSVSLAYADGKPLGLFAFNQRTRFLRAGGIYALEVTEKDKDHVSIAIPHGAFREWADDAAQHQARSKAVEIEAEAKKIEAKHADMVKEVLRPLRKVYHRLPFNQRMAFELNVLRALRRVVDGGTDGE